MPDGGAPGQVACLRPIASPAPGIIFLLMHFLRPVACVLGLLAAACSTDETGPEPRVPVGLTVQEGDGQTATSGRAVGDPVLVRVTGEDGAGVAGVSVTFQVTGGGGSVEFAQAATTPAGVASPGDWTLGDPGPQQLTASVEGLSAVSIAAVATGAPAAVVFVAGGEQTAEVGAAVATIPVARVTDAMDRPLAKIPVEFRAEGGGRVTGASQLTDAQGRAAPDGWTLGTVSGVQRLLAVVPDSEIENAPAVVEVRAVPGPAARLSAVAGDDQEAEAGSPASIAPQVKVADAYGNGVAGADVVFEVTAGGGEVTGGEAVSDSAGLAAPERWTMGPAVGSNALSATVRGGPLNGASVTFAANGTPPDFDIVVHHVAGSLVADAHIAAFQRAASIWTSVVGGDLPPAYMSQEELNQCGGRHFEIVADGDRVVDDVLIYANVYEIDGPGGILGLAGPCFIRAETGLPIVGIMGFDLADADALGEDGGFQGTVLHEMAHVLGFGTLWEYLELLEDSASTGNEDPHFLGAAALAAFDSVGGSSYDGGGKVPVENLGGEGTRNGHWRESVFRHELMTGWIDGPSDPLSIVTIGSLADMGYEDVDYDAADEFTLPEAAPTPRRLGRRIHVGNDILPIPVGLVDRDGRVVGYWVPRRRR